MPALGNMLGGDLEHMEQLARRFDAQVEVIGTLKTSVTEAIASTGWTGRARDEFAHEWDTSFSQSLTSLQDALQENAAIVRNRLEAIRVATS